MLLRRYEKIGKVARPVVNSSKPVKVGVSLMLYQLIDVDESEQFITLKFWIHMVYTHTLTYSLHLPTRIRAMQGCYGAAGMVLHTFCIGREGVAEVFS